MPDAALRESDAERALAAVLALSDDAIVRLDPSGVVVAWNRGAERMYGYSPDEIVGRSLATIIPADRAGELQDLLARVADGQSLEPHETIRVTKHGRRVDVSLAVTPLRDADAAVVGSVTIAKDITSERRADRAVRGGEARWRAIVESAVDGIITIDRRGRIDSFNPAAERLFGFRADEVLGRNVSMLMPQPYAVEHDHYIKRYLDTREPRVIGIGREVTGRRKDGSTFPLHLAVGEAAIDGEIKFTGIVRDLTDRVALELRLREESGLARIGELAAVLAHEVKNPLAAVSGAIQMIADHLPPDGEDREIIREVLIRLDSLSALMGDLLLYARPPHPNPRHLDVAELLASLISFFKADQEWRLVEVVVEGHSGTVAADPELLKIALQNLLLNAVQAMRGRGRLVIHLHESAELVHLDIVDTGPGIPGEIRDRIFTPFFTTKARGTGLGLATVRRIADSHGGSVVILRSSPEGTTMRLSLPRVHSGQGSLA